MRNQEIPNGNIWRVSTGLSEDDSICNICWKAWIYPCPISSNIPKNIISCTAYEPTDVYLKEQELISKFIEEWDNLRDFVLDAPILSKDIYELREYIHEIKDYIKKEREKWEERKK